MPVTALFDGALTMKYYSVNFSFASIVQDVKKLHEAHSAWRIQHFLKYSRHSVVMLCCVSVSSK